ncbi:MAG TPA: hypothetical protein PLA83_01810 [Deltaproteobacteria bacterium]|jgi:hypothetical protein|nr:hypothetical protein [Deltaproteobacteria bacterium]HQI01218.1 hypothetical protein [Deltaproteobacteria bacterium]HQJ09704.1 hypothetical protein [Deltaproteobacteria bacterium]
MGENNKENILKHLKGWHSLSLKQGEALSQGNLEEFTRLTKVSVLLQARVDDLLSGLGSAGIDQASLSLLKEIQKIQTGLVSDLRKDASELSETIGVIRKNKNSLKGYRRTQTPAPRFKSERT